MKQEKECEVCWESFIALRSTAKYCSHKCRQRAYTRRLITSDSSIQDNNRPINNISITQNRVSVTPEGVTVTKNELVSSKQVLASSSEAYTGSYCHENEISSRNKELKYHIGQLLSYHNAEIIGLSLCSTSYHIGKAWRTRKNFSLPAGFAHSEYIENELLPMLQRLSAAISEKKADILHFTLPADTREKLKSLVSALQSEIETMHK